MQKYLKRHTEFVQNAVKCTATYSGVFFPSELINFYGKYKYDFIPVKHSRGVMGA